MTAMFWMAIGLGFLLAALNAMNSRLVHRGLGLIEQQAARLRDARESAARLTAERAALEAVLLQSGQMVALSWGGTAEAPVLNVCVSSTAALPARSAN